MLNVYLNFTLLPLKWNNYLTIYKREASRFRSV